MFTFISHYNGTEHLKHAATQAVKDKVAKNRGWAVCSSSFNFNDKSISYVIMLNPEKTAEKTVTAAEICKDFGWKDFSFSDNCESIMPIEE